MGLVHLAWNAGSRPGPHGQQRRAGPTLLAASAAAASAYKAPFSLMLLSVQDCVASNEQHATAPAPRTGSSHMPAYAVQGCVATSSQQADALRLQVLYQQRL